MEERNKYIDKLTAQLKGWEAEIQKLEAKADKASADVKAEYEERIKELRDKKDKANSKLEELRQSSQESWEDLKKSLDNLGEELNVLIKKAFKIFQ